MIKTDCRPVFFHNKNPYVSAGILFYVKTDPKTVKYLLLNYDKTMYSDCGGKSESIDNTLLSVAVRETDEELNGLVPPYKIKEVIYFKSSKYALYIAEVNNTHDLDTSIFCNIETHTGVERKVVWMDCWDFETLQITKKLNGRLHKLNIVWLTYLIITDFKMNINK